MIQTIDRQISKTSTQLLTSPSTSHFRSQTSGSGVLNQSQILEENSEKFQKTWNLIDRAQSYKSFRSYNQQATTEPNYIQDFTLAGQLIPGKLYKLIPSEFYYCYIPIKGQKSPLNCTIYCDGDFMIMLSFTSVYPTKFNCDQVIRTRTWAIRHNNENKLYIAIVTQKLTDVKFNMHFGQAESFRKLVRISSNHEKIQMSQEMPKIPQFIVHQNKVQAGKKTNKYEMELTRSDRFMQVLKVRNLQKKNFVEQSQQKSIDLIAKELAHDESKFIHLILRNRHNKSQQTILWISLLQILKLGFNVQKILQSRKKQILKNDMMIFHLRFRFQAYNKRLQKKRGNKQQRVISDTIMLLQMYCKQTKNTLINNSFNKIIPILKFRAQLYIFKQKAITINTKLQLIKIQLNIFMNNIREYKQYMIQKWDQYTMKMLSYQSIQKLDKKYISLLRQIDEKGHKTFFQQLFINILMRDRIHSHIQEQHHIKNCKDELKLAKLQYRFATELVDKQTLKLRITKLSNQIDVLRIQNQLFMHCDVERFVKQVIEQSSAILLDEDNVQLSQEKSARNRFSLKRQRTRRISKRS